MIPKNLPRLLGGLTALAVLASSVPASDWTQWGGPNRNFMTDAPGLAASWPGGGPKTLWKRDLGEGYSSILAEGARLYTMYRVPSRIYQVGKKDQEVVVAIEAASGKTIWEYRYDAPALPDMDLEYGPGPHSTPLIVGNMLFAAGAMGMFAALDKNTGAVRWSHDMFREYGVKTGRGYTISPIAYKNTVILTTSRPGKSFMAFDQATGKLLWENLNFQNAPASPVLIRVADSGSATPGKTPAKATGKKAAASSPPAEEEQLLSFRAGEVIAVNPANGELLWSYPHQTEWGLNISTPIWWQAPGEGTYVFLSSAYNSGSRLLKLTRSAGKTTPQEMWFNNRMRIHIGNAIHVGDYVFGSSGDFGPAFFAAADVKTGQVKWQDRTFSRASFVYAEGKFIILDEDGTLGLATADGNGLKVVSRASVLEKTAWTPPTLAGTKLYVRDRKTIRALDLGVVSQFE